MKTGLIASDTYQNHNTGNGHPEKPDRVTAVIDKLRQNKNLMWEKSIKFNEKYLNITHSEDYILDVKKSFPNEGLKFLDGDTIISPGSESATIDAVGSIISAIDGIEKKRDPGQPLFINMYTEGDNYPNIKKLPSNLEDALDYLKNNNIIKEAFGEKVVSSYLKLKKQELSDFNSKENFSKKETITDWEKTNTLDC